MEKKKSWGRRQQIYNLPHYSHIYFAITKLTAKSPKVEYVSVALVFPECNALLCYGWERDKGDDNLVQTAAAQL